MNHGSKLSTLSNEPTESQTKAIPQNDRSALATSPPGKMPLGKASAPETKNCQNILDASSYGSLIMSPITYQSNHNCLRLGLEGQCICLHQHGWSFLELGMDKNVWCL